MPYIRTEDAVRWSVGNPVVAAGVTQDGVTITGLQLDYSDDELEWLEAIASMANGFNPLPASGWIERDIAYGHGDDIVIVRRNHSRDNNDPVTDTANYIAKNHGQIQWETGEQVHKGLKRWYNGTRYKCLIAHVTASGLEPSSTPTHWQEQ